MTAPIAKGDGLNTCQLCSGLLCYEPMPSGHVQSRCYTCWDVRPIPRRTVQEFEASEPVHIGVVARNVYHRSVGQRKRQYQVRHDATCVQCKRTFLTVRGAYCSEHCRVAARRLRSPLTARRCLICCQRLRECCHVTCSTRCASDLRQLARRGLYDARVRAVTGHVPNEAA